MTLISQVESLLFISNHPLSLKQLAALTKRRPEEIEEALVQLKEKYQGAERGVILAQVGKQYQLVTAPQNAKLVQEFIKEEITGELTPAQLEALTVIAYRGPVSKAELELIRGVNCSLILRHLLMRGLIEEGEGKKGQPLTYQISFEFLKHLGLSSAQELPDYERLNQNKNLKEFLASGLKEESQ